MNKKKLLLIVLLLCCFLLTGCVDSSVDSLGEMKGDKISIVCTAFPQYDWVMNLLGEEASRFEVTLLNHQGADMHSFQPTAANMVSMANCDLFIHIGGYSEGWVPAALESAENDDAVVLTLLDHVHALEEEFTEGMDHDHNHEGHGHDGFSSPSDHEQEHDHEEVPVEYDEHLWLSLRCAKDACQAITNALVELDSEHAEIYMENSVAYLAQLDQLDQEYEEAVNNGSNRTILFADRFPFRYLIEDYNLEYLAAFPGCSAETEASFDTILYLAEELEHHQLTSVVTLEGSKKDFAETVLRTAQINDAEILVLNSMQSVNQRQIDDGITYLEIMECNLEVLKNALC